MRARGVAPAVVALLVVASAWQAAAKSSQFRKEIDVNKLDEMWADEEDDGWHEDTYEWKGKEREKKQANARFDPSDPTSFGAAMMAQNGGGMQVR